MTIQDKEEERTDDLHLQAVVWNQILGVVDSAILKCATKIHFFDAVRRPTSLQEIANTLLISNDHFPALRRLMRYLSHMRLINVHKYHVEKEGEEEIEKYSLTEISSTYLIDESKKSLLPLLRWILEEDNLVGLYSLDVCLSGEPGIAAMEKVKGDGVFDRVAKDPVLVKQFNDGMTCTVGPTIEAVMEDCPALFEGVETVVDVGGGAGAVAEAIVKAFPGIKCTVLELPYVVNACPELAGVEFLAGDMFSYVPCAQAVLLTRVLHDWNEEKALQILKKCREAIAGDNGKLVIIDMVILEDDSREMQHVKLAYDMIMMAYAGGEERTEKEWESLLLKAGFRDIRFTRIVALHHVIEARVIID